MGIELKKNMSDESKIFYIMAYLNSLKQCKKKLSYAYIEIVKKS